VSFEVLRYTTNQNDASNIYSALIEQFFSTHTRTRKIYDREA